MISHANSMAWHLVGGLVTFAVIIAAFINLVRLESDAHERAESRMIERRATYDRYMSQCLTEHMEYECAEKLWRFRP